MQSLARVDLLGAATAIAIYLLCILVFIARLTGNFEWGNKIGIPLLLTSIPLMYLAYCGPEYNRTTLYYVQIGLMLAYLVCELVLDYVLKVDFRSVRWMLIVYVTIFFAGTGGMIGVAGKAGKPWSVTSVVLFLIMGILAFFQRARTGV